MLRFKGLLAIEGSAWDRESEAAFVLTSALAVKPSPLVPDASSERREALAPSSRGSRLAFIDGGYAASRAARPAAVRPCPTSAPATNGAEIASAAIVAITGRDNARTA